MGSGLLERYAGREAWDLARGRVGGWCGGSAGGWRVLSGWRDGGEGGEGGVVGVHVVREDTWILSVVSEAPMRGLWFQSACIEAGMDGKRLIAGGSHGLL